MILPHFEVQKKPIPDAQVQKQGERPKKLKLKERSPWMSQQHNACKDVEV